MSGMNFCLYAIELQGKRVARLGITRIEILEIDANPVEGPVIVEVDRHAVEFGQIQAAVGCSPIQRKLIAAIGKLDLRP
jgi:hypothetical protein